MKKMIFAATLATATIAAPAPAWLYWTTPDFSGAPVRGDEPGIAQPLPGAKPAEVDANLVWTLRAALNVAALQCQFSPPLMTVRNYNTIISQHDAELDQAQATLTTYFRRTHARTWQRDFDSHTTRSYNGMSTFHAQLGFCETASRVGKAALAAPRGQLHEVARTYMREIRNSLVPRSDRLFTLTYLTPRQIPLADNCWDRKGRIRKICWNG